MNPQIQMQFSDLNFIVPIVSSEGTMALINEASIPTLLFFQMRQGQNNKPAADVVAAVKMHNLQELKDFYQSIGEVIHQHENKEK